MTNYQKYIGGTRTKANRNLSPVYIGAINTQGGQVSSVRTGRRALQLAVQYINTYLGGVRGHPIKA